MHQASSGRCRGGHASRDPFDRRTVIAAVATEMLVPHGLAQLGFPATVDMADWLIRAINALN
jgi:hypothetical protein